MKRDKLYFSFLIDCEATQPAVNDKKLGERSSREFAATLERFGLKGTFHVIPTDIEASPKLYKDLRAAGHEIGLHLHPAADGYAEFFGIYGPDDQRKILGEAKDRFISSVGFEPGSLCIGYGSVNDHSYGVFHDLGFRHGTTCIPTRILPECASVHAGKPLDIHYAHRWNRVLVGDLDYVEVPCTLDPDSRMWGGKHPLDLRVELVDSKNHWYTIKKAVDRQLAAKTPVMQVRGATHNIFEFGDKKDFRRQTLEGIIRGVQSVADAAGLELVGVTTEEVAKVYRQAVPLGSTATMLALDRRGYLASGTGPRPASAQKSKPAGKRKARA